MLILQNCLHVLNKTILQQYRVHSFFKKLRRDQLVYGYTLFFFPLPKLMIHLYSSIDKAAVQEKKQTILFIIG